MVHRAAHLGAAARRRGAGRGNGGALNPPRRGADESDEDLAAAAAGGDRAALEALLGRHADRVHAICRRVLHHHEDALDATQEALMLVVRRIDSFDSRSAFTTWLYRVTVNAALDEGRRRARRPRPAAVIAEHLVPGPEAAVIERLNVEAALAELPAEFRACVALRDLADLDYATIASVLGIPPGTVRSRIARARAALAARLGNPEPASGRHTGQEP